MSLTLPNALRAYKDGAQIDFRQTWAHAWEENPFRKCDKLIDGGQDSVLMVEAALGPNAEFRIRPPKRSRIAVFLDETPFNSDGPAEKLAKRAVQAALKDVREHLASKVPAAGRDFLDQIEVDFCGEPAPLPPPQKVVPGSRWKVYDLKPHSGKVAQVSKVSEGNGYAYFGPPESSLYGGWYTHRFLTAGMDRKEWEDESPRFEYVGGPL